MQNIVIIGVLLIAFLILIVIFACIGAITILDAILDWRDEQLERRNRKNNTANNDRMGTKSDMEIR